MQFVQTHKWLVVSLALLLLLVLLVASQIIYIMRSGTEVAVPEIPRGTETFGDSGELLKFAVLGDSTGVGQGADYADSVARGTAAYLARTHQVQLTNYAVSGATVKDVHETQLEAAVQQKPDLVLLSAGANDVTSLAGLKGISLDTAAIINELRVANPQVRIVLTGSPAVGSVHRFAPPTQWLARQRVKQVNSVFAAVASDKKVVLLPLAEKTGEAFLRGPELFAADKYHPNAAGYALWLPVVTTALADLGY
jgi:lysophospholipase L1-like esterase